MKFSDAQMAAAVVKFNKYSRGVQTGYRKSGTGTSSQKQQHEMLYADLVNPSLYSPSSLKGMLVELAPQFIKNVVDPGLFGKTSVYLRHRTPIDDIITFSTKEAYCIIRSAYLEQISNKSYIASRNRKAEIRTQLAGLRTKSELKADLYKELEGLS